MEPEIYWLGFIGFVFEDGLFWANESYFNQSDKLVILERKNQK